MVLPPFVRFDRQTLSPQMTIREVPGTLYGLSKNGWINPGSFKQVVLLTFLSVCSL